MQMLAECPRCSQVLQLTLAAADRRIKCPRCGRLFKVPPVDALGKAIDAIKDAKAQVYVDENGNMYG